MIALVPLMPYFLTKLLLALVQTGLEKKNNGLYK